ncbi:MAG: sugar ABC transporter ATP-binding protein [Verrucomicrobiales bacterium]|nr:sugar ABC transporter ATP-binding protein [Verrucomicrobiales bacterium]
MPGPTTTPPAGTPLLAMRGISKRFPGVVALDGVDLAVRAGEVLALVGENGAGKSTLMKILGGVYQPDAGEILWNGQPVRIAGVNDAMRLGIAFIHQELNVLGNLDVAANVFLGREPRTAKWLVDRRRIHAEARVYLERLGVTVPTTTRVDRLPLAQQQLVEIAKALSLDARLIIMDEPTSSLTVQETDRLLALVNELRDQGVSIIYISHRLGELSRCADRVVVLRDGKNAGALAKNEIEHDRIVALMVGREITQHYIPSTSAKTPGFLRVRHLRSGRYPSRTVSFDAARGEILGFAGLVGAGRSEMAKVLVGLDPFGSAEVTLGERSLSVRRPADALANGIYLVPEDRRGEGLVVRMSVGENLSLPWLRRFARFGLVARAWERRNADEQIAALKVKTPHADALVVNLSGGNQQKVVLGKWLAMDPKVLIFDEPTRGIDVGAKAEIYRLMRDLAERGTVVLMISSDMEEILHVSDRVAVMHEGSITGIVDRDGCTEENIMQLAVGRRLSADSRGRPSSE